MSNLQGHDLTFFDKYSPQEIDSLSLELPAVKTGSHATYCFPYLIVYIKERRENPLIHNLENNHDN